MATGIREQPGTSQICAFAGIDPPSQNVAPRQYLDHLISGGLLAEAVRFVANAMEPALSIEWALDCLTKLQATQRPDARRAAFAATEKWLKSKEDTDRRAAKELAEQAGLDTPEGCLAMAVFLAGGSIAPSTAPDVEAPAHVSQRLAAGAVTLAVVQDPKRATERHQSVLAAGAARLNRPAS